MRRRIVRAVKVYAVLDALYLAFVRAPLRRHLGIISH
jgi:hypothetical protein